MPLRLLDPKKGKFYEVLESTNETIQSKEFEPGSWILANYQSAGKGRKGKKWSVIGEDYIIFSGKNELSLTDYPITLLSLFAASSLLKAIFEWYPEKEKECKIKWPNDIYRNQKKIAGFLIESNIIQDRFQIIIGFGLNIYGSQVPPSLPAAGFLLDYPPLEGSKERILYSFIDFWNESLQKVAGLKEIGRELDWIERHSIGIGKKIEFSIDGNLKMGKILGFDSHGFLVVLDEEGMKYSLIDSDDKLKILES